MAEKAKYIDVKELSIILDVMRNPDSEFVTDDYIDGFSGVCDQSALTYYKGDYELVDEHDELMIDVDRIVGIDNINQAIEEGLETVYIRNLYFGIDYEVTIVEGSYHRLHFDGDYEDSNDWED